MQYKIIYLAIDDWLCPNICVLTFLHISPGVKCQVHRVQAMNDFKDFNILILIIIYVI